MRRVDQTAQTSVFYMCVCLYVYVTGLNGLMWWWWWWWWWWCSPPQVSVLLFIIISIFTHM